MHATLLKIVSITHLILNFEFFQSEQNYFVSISSLFSIFFTLWSNKKNDYIMYCKQKADFWPMLASTLQINKKKELRQVDKKPLISQSNNNTTISWAASSQNINELHNLVNEETTSSDYSEYFGFDNRTYGTNELMRFNEFILEASCKSASYAFKIFSIEYFQLIASDTAKTDASSSSMTDSSKKFFKFLTENLFDRNLIEKWLDFYVFQLKQDINDEIRLVLTQIDNYFLVNNETNQNQNALSKPDKRPALKSKLLFDSIKTFVLLVNKATRLGCIGSNADLVNMKRVKLDLVFGYLIDAIGQIIKYFFTLNNLMTRIKQEAQDTQDQLMHEQITLKLTNTTIQTLDYVSSMNLSWLKHSGEIDKQFYLVSNTLMILITSIKDL